MIRTIYQLRREIITFIGIVVPDKDATCRRHVERAVFIDSILIGVGRRRIVDQRDDPRLGRLQRTGAEDERVVPGLSFDAQVGERGRRAAAGRNRHVSDQLPDIVALAELDRDRAVSDDRVAARVLHLHHRLLRELGAALSAAGGRLEQRRFWLRSRP